MRFSLVQKLTIALVGVAMLGGLIITSLLYSTVDRFERVLLDESSSNQLSVWMTVDEMYPQQTLNLPAGQALFKFTEATRNTLPQTLQSLQPGLHHDIEIDGREHHVIVRKLGEQFFALIQDIDELEQAEEFASAAYKGGMLLVGVMMFALIFWTTRRAVDPVVRLANEVQSLQPEGEYSPIAQHYQGEEVSQIAQALDGFRENLAAFVERERMFTAAASHELRTPLAVIASSNEILQGEPGLSDTGKLLGNRIQRSTVQMEDMISSLLFLARESEGKNGHLVSNSISVSRIVEEIVADHTVLLARDPVELKSNIHSTVVVQCEESHLRMIVNNLLRNAENHTHNGEITVEVSKEELSITDTGSGIEPELLKNVFRRNVSDWQSHGLGFGLYLCKQLCDRHGWELKLSSTLGEGTKASVIF